MKKFGCFPLLSTDEDYYNHDFVNVLWHCSPRSTYKIFYFRFSILKTNFKIYVKTVVLYVQIKSLQIDEWLLEVIQ